MSLVTKLGFHIVFLQIETYNSINLIIVDDWDKNAGQLIDQNHKSCISISVPVMWIAKHFILKYRSTFYYLQHESIFCNI